ncbi:MAG TPA: DUF3800 domain-containing protein [Phycisphaerae bacterium]|nr:DUF3800 domain-containing protein [Phycisphaerae bacterium]
MYLLYLDDSGSAKNTREEYLVLGGISVFERQVHWISQELDKLAAEILPSDPKSVEFHASEIFSGRVPPWNGMDKTARRDVIKKVLQVLQLAHHTTHAFGCAVHKASYPTSDPMKIAFEELCHRFDLQLKRMYNLGDKQRGIIILDKSTHETTLQDMTRDFRTLGTQWGVVQNLADVPLFVDSKASRIVQLADHVSYALFRAYEAADFSYLNIVLNRFDEDGGRLHGLCHKQTNTSNCMCQACMSRRLTNSRWQP